MKMSYSGPVDWAEGTSFNPVYDDRNDIAVALYVSFKNEQEDYEDLIQWMKGNLPTGCTIISSEDADMLWDNLSM